MQFYLYKTLLLLYKVKFAFLGNIKEKNYLVSYMVSKESIKKLLCLSNSNYGGY